MDISYSWPNYVTGLFARVRCPVALVVLCPTKRIADWAREPIVVGHRGFVLEPVPVGPETGPLVSTLEEAVATPELAVMAVATGALKDCGKNDLEIMWAALAELNNKGDRNALLYAELVLGLLSVGNREIMEEYMSSGTIEFKSNFAKRHRAQGEAQAVLLVLESRGIEVSTEVKEAIMSCDDLDRLAAMLRRVATVTSAEELLD
jgi:hypothetical protein